MCVAKLSESVNSYGNGNYKPPHAINSTESRHTVKLSYTKNNEPTLFLEQTLFLVEIFLLVFHLTQSE